MQQRHGVGSNQYQTLQGNSPGGSTISPTATLMQQVLPERRRCGEVWGTKCSTWVEPPLWSHAKHGFHLLVKEKKLTWTTETRVE